MSEPLDGIAEAEKARTVRRGRVNGWTAFALAVFLLLALLSSLEVWRACIGSSALASGSGRVLDIVHGDVIFEAWLVARNPTPRRSAARRRYPISRATARISSRRATCCPAPSGR